MNNLLIIKKSLAFSMTIMLTLVILLSTVGLATAQVNRVAPGKNVPTAPSQALGPTDPAELAAFLDQLLGKQMEEHHIAQYEIRVYAKVIYKHFFKPTLPWTAEACELYQFAGIDLEKDD